MRHLILRAWMTLWSHAENISDDLVALFAIMGQTTRSLRRAARLYGRLVMKFRSVGATWREALVMPFAIPAALGGSTFINDLAHGMVGGMALKIAAYTTTQTGTAVDMVEAEGRCFGVLVTGTLTDGTHALKLTEADTSGGSYSDMAKGAFAKGATGDDDTFDIVAATRAKRFVKCTDTVTGSPSTGGILGVLVLSMRKSGA